ncbi:hypothetical protein QVD17_01425 [Tagetes erecta]|uniref:Uncharacterized protein n=1 Tax=Tagetes erecta TaxID=13708 RepID=A0AAD8L4W9_TARER|nr:hypothetical protein QVD17_01425 [Tagetes erecta]
MNWGRHHNFFEKIGVFAGDGSIRFCNDARFGGGFCRSVGDGTWLGCVAGCGVGGASWRNDGSGGMWLGGGGRARKEDGGGIPLLMLVLIVVQSIHSFVKPLHNSDRSLTGKKR